MRERIVVTVPLAIVGEAPGVTEGGVLGQIAYEVEVESLPGDIPQEVTLDVSGLGINENLTLADVELPEGVTLVSEEEQVAVTVTPPTEISEEEMEAAGIVEEPSEEAAEEVEVEEETEEVSPEEGEGPAGQNLQP
jgi:large subunit ribosomal protein L25